MQRMREDANLIIDSPVLLADSLGKAACAEMSAHSRSHMGQFLSPPRVARLLASMFGDISGEVRLLDPGAGVGALTAAFVEEVLQREHRPKSLHLTVWEAEKAFLTGLEEVLKACVKLGHAAGVPVTYSLNSGDMLEGATGLLCEDDLFSNGSIGSRFTHAILNPPYCKINSSSEARRLIRRAGLETSNLYTGFLWVTARLLTMGGEMVAITPRSFCNGPYFLPFRKSFFGLMALENLHAFDRRNALFDGDEVLQENLVMGARRSDGPRTSIILSGSDGSVGGATRSRTVPYSRVLDPKDSKIVLHLALEGADDDVKLKMGAMHTSLVGSGMGVSTGRVVDFRARDFLRKEPENGAAPLIYPQHCSAGAVRWPSEKGRKPNALVSTAATQDLLVPNGCYVLVKRFTSKEERKRVVATVFRPEGTLKDFPAVGFENHLNYFHSHGGPMNEVLAVGLAVYLNSSLVDSYFRQFSGHTQVNATDLRSLRYPSKEQLTELAKRIKGNLSEQLVIDQLVDEMTQTTRP